MLEAVAVGGPQVDSGLLVRVLPDAPADALDQLTAAGLLGPQLLVVLLRRHR